MTAPDSFDSPDGRTYSGPAGPRDIQAERDGAAFTGWMEAQGYNPDLTMVCSNFGPADMREAFTAGVQYARDLDAAALAAEVRAGNVRIEAGEPQPAPERLAAAARIVRDILESLCRRAGLPLESTDVPGEPARNYELAERLGISRVFGLPDAPQPAPGHLLVMRGTIALRDAEIGLLREQLAKAAADRDGLRRLLGRYERITTAWSRGMYCAWIDCVRGDVKAAIECLAEGLDGYDGPEWDRTETGAQWWERTKAEEGL